MAATPEHARGLGRLKDQPDDRDYLWRERVFREPLEGLPPAFRLGATGPVLDQGNTPECVSHASAKLKLHQEWRVHRHYYGFDADWLYQQCKLIDGYPNDEGTDARSACKVMASQGIRAFIGATKTTGPQGEDTWTGGTERYYKVGSYTRLRSLPEMKEALFTTDSGVLLGLEVDSAWQNPSPEGVIGDPTSDILGGHEVCIFGWDDVLGALFGVNSWGTSWGLSGTFWLPYTHLRAHPDWDCWKALDDPGDIKA